MNDIPLALFCLALPALLGLAAFLSGSEAALMALNRYRLLRRVKAGHPGALRAQALLQRPERLLGCILLGTHFAIILAASLATLAALRLYGLAGVAAAAVLLTLLVPILAQAVPKALAGRHPDRLAYSAARIMSPLVRVFHPLPWAVDAAAGFILRVLGFVPGTHSRAVLNQDQLRSLAAEAGTPTADRYRNMLLSVLDLESATVEDIMVPRHEIVGLDLDQPLEEIAIHIRNSRHTRLPVYHQSLDRVVGMLHLRKALIRMSQGDFSQGALLKCLDKIHFVPAHMPLDRLLLTFRRENLRLGLVVDEYGDVLGLATLEDLLREIVGEFTPDPHHDVVKEQDGGYLVDAGLGLRELNRLTGWNLPTEGPKTLNGLIIEYLETIPAPGTRLVLGHLDMEITKTENNVIKQVRIHP